MKEWIFDLKELIYTLANKSDGKYISMFSDSQKASCNNTGSGKSLRRKERQHTLKCSLLAKDGEIKEKFRKKFSNCQLSESQSAWYQNVLNSSQHPWQTNVKLGNNSCEIMNNLRDAYASISFTDKTKKRTHFMLNQTRCHRFSPLLSLRAT